MNEKIMENQQEMDKYIMYFPDGTSKLLGEYTEPDAKELARKYQPMFLVKIVAGKGGVAISF